MITILSPIYDLSPMKNNQSRFLKDGFLVEFRLASSAENATGCLFHIPGSLSCTIRNLREERKGKGHETHLMARDAFDRAQNYRIAGATDAPCSVLEVTLNLFSSEHPEWPSIRVGVPFACFPRNGPGVFAVAYTGVRLMLFRDGKLLDEDYPVGDPAGSEVKVTQVSPVAKEVALYCTRERPLKRFVEIKRRGTIQYYMPEGFNTWVGDIVPYFHNGRFHIFYLMDRRHHASRFGKGAHFFSHLSSTNMKNWTEHVPAVELEYQWESCGTGVPFVHKGEFYLGYGLHTNRVIRDEKLISVLLESRFDNAGAYSAVETNEYPDYYPSGATYAISRDGVHFRKSGKVFHVAKNPSIYSKGDGSLVMFAAGTWEADSPDGPWRCVNRDFPAGGPGTPMRNTIECPSWFEWNGYHYLIMGVTGFWSGKIGEPLEDSAVKGRDIYDGLAVPMVSPFGDDRMILAGWLPGIGFGSALILRELVQYPDGHLGMKWLGEAMPKRGEIVESARVVSFDGNQEVDLDTAPVSPRYYVMIVNPGDSGGRLAVRFKSNDNPEKSCELLMMFRRGRVQFATFEGNRMSEPLNTVREDIVMREQGYLVGWSINSPNAHFRAFNFCIENVDVMKQPFELRICMHWNQKIGATVIDVEIGRQRTIISNRPGLKVDSVAVAADDPSIALKRIEIIEADLPEAGKIR